MLHERERVEEVAEEGDPMVGAEAATLVVRELEEEEAAESKEESVHFSVTLTVKALPDLRRKRKTRTRRRRRGRKGKREKREKERVEKEEGR